uniref:Bpf002 n=1 Tax=Haemophilus influenzae biotype aegyptius TaxID=725 RepID=Q8GGG3_HAEIF|nr:Bpf002 [Haemophilus influenzae biotype aegyptius]
MKKQLIAMVSLLGTVSVLSACTSNEDITFPTMISPLALDVETCSSQAKSDFQLGVAAYKDKKYAQSFELFTKASEKNCANADFYLAANIIPATSQKTLMWQKKNLNRLVIKG